MGLKFKKFELGTSRKFHFGEMGNDKIVTKYSLLFSSKVF